MNDANMPNGGTDSSTEAEGGAAHELHAGPDEHLATARLPPLRRPLPPPRTPSQPPAGASSVQPTSGASPAPHAIRPPPSRWWRSLLESTFPPAVPEGPEPGAGRHRTGDAYLGAACAAIGLVLLLPALVLGVRQAPSQTLLPPVVAAAEIVARALVVLGLLVAGLAFLRTAERFFSRTEGPR